MENKKTPLFCLTASGYLIQDKKVLLIKHKKLGVWLSPGGHLEEGELPYQAAEREFWEETGIKVKATGYKSDNFMPIPFKCGLHWVCRDNYLRRLENKKPLKEWKKGCEQHYDQGYLVKPISGVSFKKNVEETDGIAWFTLEELENLDTFEDVKESIKSAFIIIKKILRDKAI